MSHDRRPGISPLSTTKNGPRSRSSRGAEMSLRSAPQDVDEREEALVAAETGLMSDLHSEGVLAH